MTGDIKHLKKKYSMMIFSTSGTFTTKNSNINAGNIAIHSIGTILIADASITTLYTYCSGEFSDPAI